MPHSRADLWLSATAWRELMALLHEGFGCASRSILGWSGETPAVFYSHINGECGCMMPAEELCRAAVLSMARLGTRCSAAAFEAPVRANAAN